MGGARPGHANNAYATAKFAVRGFSEALIEDLRTNAPQVRVAVVLPGHVGTDILANTRRALGQPDPEDMSDAEVEELIPESVRAGLVGAGMLAEGASADELRRMIAQFYADFRDKAPLSAADAATIILDGARSGAWRILVGEDAKWLDTQVRAKPEDAYNYSELFSAAEASGPAATPERWQPDPPPSGNGFGRGSPARPVKIPVQRDQTRRVVKRNLSNPRSLVGAAAAGPAPMARLKLPAPVLQSGCGR